MNRWTIISAVALAALPAAGLARERVYVKDAPVAAVQMDSDRDACVQQVLAYLNGPSSPVPRLRNPTTDQSIAHAFDMRGPRAAAAAEIRCMAAKGYVSLPLSDDENKALSRARGVPARDRWYDAFVTADLSGRIEAARASAATPG